MNDCAWCGTGNGMCDDCMSKMFAQSAQIAAAGDHLASVIYGNTATQQDEQSSTEPEAQTGKGGRHSPQAEGNKTRETRVSAKEEEEGIAKKARVLAHLS